MKLGSMLIVYFAWVETFAIFQAFLAYDKVYAHKLALPWKFAKTAKNGCKIRSDKYRSSSYMIIRVLFLPLLFFNRFILSGISGKFTNREYLRKLKIILLSKIFAKCEFKN